MSVQKTLDLAKLLIMEKLETYPYPTNEKQWLHINNFIVCYPNNFDNKFFSTYLRYIMRSNNSEYDRAIIKYESDCLAHVEIMLQNVIPSYNDIIIFADQLVQNDRSRKTADETNYICVNIMKLFTSVKDLKISSNVLAKALDNEFISMVEYLVHFVPLDSACIENACNYTCFNNIIVTWIDPFIRVTPKAINNAIRCDNNEIVVFLTNSGLYNETKTST